MLNVEVSQYGVSNFNWDDITSITSKYSMPIAVGEIIQNAILRVDVYLPMYLVLPKDEGLRDDFRLETEMHITYSDMFKRAKYECIVFVKHRIQIIENETNAPDLYNDQYKYMRVKYGADNILYKNDIYSKEDGKYVGIDRFDNKI